MAAASAAGLLVPGCPSPQESGSTGPKVVPGRIHGQDATFGHLLRSGELADRKADTTRNVDVLIVGGGVAGLSAAWRLHREGAKEIVVVDAGEEPGGNSRAGRNPTSRFPWGAHYLRAPTQDHRSLEVFLEEVGLIRGRDAEGHLDFDTRAVCAAPQERIYEGGLWAEGLFPPPRSRSDPALAQFKRFDEQVSDLAKRKGLDGRRAFAIPVELSSRDPELVALDTLPFADWLTSEGYTDPTLLWYLEYACRDDYGCTLKTASAWAGLHYFAARHSSPDRDVVLAWPEGNARLVELLAKGIDVEGRSLCFRLSPGKASASSEAWIYTPDPERVTRVVAKHVIYAGPQFVLGRLLPKAPAHSQAFTYAPWLVANVTFDKQPGGIGAPLAWDNVFYESPSLGYVVANRQGKRRQPCVVTWYCPLSGPDPAAERKRLYELDHAAIATLVIDDICKAHPTLRGRVRSVDAWRWGHAMIRPVPGFLWGKDRAAALTRDDALICANSDLSGISIFEEAFYRGVVAGEEVLTRQGASFKSLL
jgi:hypothetical protein